MPGRGVGQQDVEVAARHPAHRAGRQVGDVEHGLERAPRPCRGRGGAAGTGAGSSVHRQPHRSRRDDRRPRSAEPPGPSSGRRSEGQSPTAVLAETGSGLADWRGRPCGRPSLGRDRLLVRRPERDLLDRDRGSECHDRADHAQPEGLGGREAERPVDALDHGAMNGWTAAWNCGGMAARMAAPRSPTPVSELKSNEPLLLAWVNPSMTCCGTPAAVICGTSLSWNDVAKIVPDERERDRAADLAEERQVRRRHAELPERHRVLDDDRGHRERRADAEAGDEHPEPDDRHGRVLGELGHQQDREAHDRDRARRSATCSGRSATR